MNWSQSFSFDALLKNAVRQRLEAVEIRFLFESKFDQGIAALAVFSKTTPGLKNTAAPWSTDDEGDASKPLFAGQNSLFWWKKFVTVYRGEIIYDFFFFEKSLQRFWICVAILRSDREEPPRFKLDCVWYLEVLFIYFWATRFFILKKSH